MSVLIWRLSFIQSQSFIGNSMDSTTIFGAVNWTYQCNKMASDVLSPIVVL